MSGSNRHDFIAVRALDPRGCREPAAGDGGRSNRRHPDRRGDSRGRTTRRGSLATRGADRSIRAARADGRQRAVGEHRRAGALHRQRLVYRRPLPRPIAARHRLDTADARRRLDVDDRITDRPRSVLRPPQRFLFRSESGRGPIRRPGVEQRRAPQPGMGWDLERRRPDHRRRVDRRRSRFRSRRCGSSRARRRGDSTSSGRSSGARKSTAGRQRGRTSGSAISRKPAASKDSKASSRDAVSTSGRTPPVAADNGDPRICARRGCLQEPDAEPQRGRHGQHRLRRDRSRSPSGEPDALSAFFPEKRAFFLEGAGVFDVAGLVNTTDIRPFFSRRIGLIEDLAVPIRVGAKLTGRQGHYNVGVLDVETGSLHDPALTGGSVSRQNLLAARVSRNIFQQSWIGGIVTHGNPTGRRRQHVDRRRRPLRHVDISRQQESLARSLSARDRRRGDAESRGGGRLQARLSERSLGRGAELQADWRELSTGPRLRPASRHTQDRCVDRVPAAARPLGHPAVLLRAEPHHRDQPRKRDRDLECLHGAVQPAHRVGRASGVELHSRNSSAWTLPFEVSPGVVIPPGSYRWTRYRAEVNTATKRPWVVDAAWWWGGFYGGTLRQLELGVTVKPNTHVAVSAQAERNDVTLPEGRFYTEILTIRADYNFTPNVSWANLTQYDNESRIAGWQSRFRWILRPGNDLFLVVNRGWFRSAGRQRIRAAFRSRVGEATIHVQILSSRFTVKSYRRSGCHEDTKPRSLGFSSVFS